jgi:FkbM family methyltransferase
MSFSNPQAKDNHAPRRSGLQRFVSVRRLNIVFGLTLFTLFVTLIVTGQVGRRVEFWWTGKVEVDGLTFYLNPNDDSLNQALFWSGTYEPEETQLLRSKCRPGGTVIDVGANVGWYTIIASKVVGKNGRVIAFEPEPENFAILKRNVLVNGCDNVTVEQKALSDATGTLTLYQNANSVLHSTVFDWKQGAISVEALRLDDYLENRFGKVDFVKIDVEGAEPMVLDGMRRTIQSNPSICLVVEFAPKRVIATGRQPKQYLEDFINQGFLIYMIDEKKRQLVRKTPAEILAVFEANAFYVYTNLFLQRDSD